MDGLSADAEGRAGSCATVFAAHRPRRRIIDRSLSLLLLLLALVAAEGGVATALRALAEAIVNERKCLGRRERERGWNLAERK